MLVALSPPHLSFVDEVFIKSPLYIVQDMSSSTFSHVDFYRDLAISTISLAFGRVLPNLRPSPAPAGLTGKTAIVTGANSGIGLTIALELTRQNATVYLACRNMSKANDAVSEITSQVPESEARVKTIKLDTSSSSSVRECAKGWKEAHPDTNIDILVHNAGIANNPGGQLYSEDSFPMIYATNVLGSFLLTNLLEPFLSKTARIIFTTSTGQYAGTFRPTFSLSTMKNRLESGFHAAKVKDNDAAAESDLYANSKSMQVAFAKLLQKRWDTVAKDNNTTNRRIANAFSPGFVRTPIFLKGTPRAIWEDPSIYILKATTVLAVDVAQGAATGVWLATTDDEAVVGQGKGGGFWQRMTRRAARVDMMSTEQLERFWIRWEADAGIQWR